MRAPAAASAHRGLPPRRSELRCAKPAGTADRRERRHRLPGGRRRPGHPAGRRGAGQHRHVRWPRREGQRGQGHGAARRQRAQHGAFRRRRWLAGGAARRRDHRHRAARGRRALGMLPSGGTLVCAATRIARAACCAARRSIRSTSSRRPPPAAFAWSSTPRAGGEAGYRPRRQHRPARRRQHRAALQASIVAAWPRGRRAGQDPRAQPARLRARPRCT